MKTLAQTLFDAGLRQTAWLDQQTGAEKRGTFQPTATDPVTRYGNPDGLRVKDWPARNKVGAHASGELSLVTPELAQRALEAVADPANDLADLDFVNGAGAFVLQQARAKGILDDPTQTGNKALDALKSIDKRAEELGPSLPHDGGPNFQALLRTFKDFLGFVAQTAKAGGA